MKKFRIALFLLTSVLFAACFFTCSSDVDETDFIKVVPPEPNPNEREGQLVVVGNKIFNARTAQEVRLTGVNIYDYNVISDLMDLTVEGRRSSIVTSIKAVFEKWRGNIIRFPLEINNSEIFLGEGKRPMGDFPEFLETIIYYVKLIEQYNDGQPENLKKYIILDLHTYVMLSERCMSFWREWITVPEFVNNPYVIFGMLNEPHDVSWEVWRNGGYETPDGNYRYGYQQLLEMIRDAGAKNIVTAGGLDWGYDLRGVVGEAPGDRKKYALIDQGSGGDKSKTGYGIIYETHIYPWKGMGEWYQGGQPPGKAMEYCYNDWVKKAGSARKIAPVLVGECGWSFSDIAHILSTVPVFNNRERRNAIVEAEFGPGGSAYHTNWMTGVLNFFDDDKTFGSQLHYTAWCFSSYSSPILLLPTGPGPGWDPNNYNHFDPDAAERIEELWRKIDLSPEEFDFIYTPNHYSGQYFYDHMRAAALKRGDTVLD